jgi:hypothetical protein
MMTLNVIPARSQRVYKLLCFCILVNPILAIAYDPMAPPGYQQSEIGSTVGKEKTIKRVKVRDFTLRQIVIYPHNKSAVINGYVVNEGSYLKNALVKKISKNTVELLVLGKKKVLTLEAKLPRIRR